MTIQVRRVTMKSLQEALQRRIAENDDAVTRVREAKRDLRERERDLNKIRGAK